MTRRFQFSLRTLLESTGFMALAAGCWHIQGNSELIVGFAIPIFIGAAIGHLFGRGLAGSMIGVGLVAAFGALVLILNLIQSRVH